MNILKRLLHFILKADPAYDERYGNPKTFSLPINGEYEFKIKRDIKKKGFKII